MVAAVLPRRQAWTVTIIATLTMTVSYIDRQTLSVLAPAVTKALDINNETYGWLGSAFSISYLFGTPFAGWWIDRIGARRGLVASVFAWSAVAALHALVPGFGVLFGLRLLLGITEGPGFPGAVQTVQRDGATAAGQADAVRDLGDRADLRVAVLVLGHEQHALLVADVDGQGDVHRGEHDGVFKGYEEQCGHGQPLHGSTIARRNGSTALSPLN
jgi:hypothetical protein